jgi:hypothetical protein
LLLSRPVDFQKIGITIPALAIRQSLPLGLSEMNARRRENALFLMVNESIWLGYIREDEFLGGAILRKESYGIHSTL